ncbi:MAG: hypothetical protein HY074_16330 [Deltaproteobacteria bacterium]|nr:hypothetical protein [Deltaproteobacteria bacterium]
MTRTKFGVVLFVLSISLLSGCIVPPSPASVCVPTATPFGGGTGTSSDPYLVCDRSHLDQVRNQPNMIYLQTVSISLGGSGNPFNPIANFGGQYDGSGFQIQDFYYNNSSDTYVGLFKQILSGAMVSNVSMTNANVTGYQYVGALAGELDGTAANCTTDGVVNGTYRVGGLAGWLVAGHLSQSSTTATANGYDMVGGLAGDNYYGTIQECFSATGSITGQTRVGGAVGVNSYGSVANSYTTSQVHGAYNYATNQVGGFIGLNMGTIATSYSATNGLPYMGALTWVFVGATSGGSIANCYYYDAGGLPAPVVAGVTSLTNAQMQTQGSFTGYDFTTPLWKMPTVNPLAPFSPQQLAPVLNWQCSSNGVSC